MKKFFLVLLCAVFLIGGCSMDNVKQEITEETQDIKQDVKEEVNDIKEDVKEIMPQKVDKSQFIGEEKAKEIALEKAGITAEGVVFDIVELDNDDGIWQYEVEYRKGTTEYSADIAADSGDIISWEIDND